MAHVHNGKSMTPDMMKELMQSMMGPGGMMGSDEMKGMMGPGIGGHAPRGTVKVIVATAGSRASHGFFDRLIRNPLVLIGAGMVAGYLIHKFRQEIIAEKKRLSS